MNNMKNTISISKKYKKKMLVSLLLTAFLTIALFAPTGVSFINENKFEKLFMYATDISIDAFTRSDIAALQKQAKEEGWTFTVGENSATNRSLDELCGTIEPDNWQADAKFDGGPVNLGGLPLSFDWRDHNGVTPIRDQDGCGSCWAFSAIGAVECVIKLGENIDIDLSEQWLVSECVDAGDCGGGWPSTALDYIRYDGQQDPCGGNGAVLEEDFPYEASNMPCDCPYPHSYWIDSWTFVGSGSSIPSVNEIKQAILDHGPVSTCVYVNSPFQAYQEGVFNACDNDNGINHAVVLVGWDDNYYWDGEYYGVWIMRNSWGTNWGMDGYMYIQYRCSNIGYSTCYVDYSVSDCNDNGIADNEEIAMGFAKDCNGNGRPDECDIAYGSSPDGDNNGIPDECEACQIEKILPSDGVEEDHFGQRVAIDTDALIIGVSNDDDNGNNSGSAYIFRHDRFVLSNEEKIVASDGSSEDGFGSSLDIDDDVAIVGARWDDDNGIDSGSAYIFRYDGSEWIEEQKLLPSDGQEEEYFGFSVAIDTDVAVVSAWCDDDNGEDSGSVYVFRFDGSTWIEEQKIIASDGAENDIFGFSLDIYDEAILVGTCWHDDINPNSGAAYIYRYDGSVWIEEQKLQASDNDENDYFSWSAALSDDVAIIGASYNDDLGSKSGSAYIFRYDGSNWFEEQKLLASDGVTNDMFGLSVAIDSDTAIVGMSNDDDNGGSSGSAYAFRFDGATWIQDAKLIPLDGTELDKFGCSVSICGDIALIGAYSDDDNGVDSGSAYLFGSTSFICCPGDVTNDYMVNIDDIYFILAHWGEQGGPADANGDGIVNIDDIFFVLGYWS